MFNCENCGKTSKPHEKAHRIPISWRAKKYSNKTPTEGVKETFGQEVVQEKTVCGNCVKS